MSGRARTRLAVGTLVTAVMLLSIGWLARAPYTPEASERALLRLSWRFRPEAEEECRPRTQAELDALPVHMRTPDVCVSVPVVYRVIRQIDDARADTIRVLRGGLKQDRPVYVLLDTALPPATYRVRVALTRQRHDAAEAMVLEPLDALLRMRPGSIGLVTLDSDGAFVVRGPAARP
ncbi:MAG TPA: hypothetical protein VFU06_08905 [Longimicrobiales bacterium]|nr:hypothetical protein [Longimicrobiales bacterium]